jgi:hypothetical protein
MTFIQLPKKRVRARMGVKESTVIRCPGHLRFIRSLECAISGKNGHVCSGPIVACHYRLNGNGGTGMKCGDDRTWPGCDGAHAEQHRIGEPAFEAQYKIQLGPLCEALWQASPPGTAYRLKTAKEKA